MKATEKSAAEPRSRVAVADIALALFVMLTITMLIVPLPTPLLDVLLASNLALACLLLLTALYVPHALSLAALPTLLLLTTLYRLALNVSSTRLILLQADAGRVIRAFGELVVGGNYVVGGVVFLILTLIQYLVIAKGSERIAEVGARFSLDAMPGKQLAIDADLRAGALSVDAARGRRAAIEHESQFYGAMDGAMKFVKGDAIAGIVIALISLIGGAAIGVGMHGLSFTESLRRYGLLTIGDGLVAQIPSLVISTAAGLVVTRVASREHESSLGADLATQLFSEPRVLGGAAGFFCVLGLVPGLPALPFLLVGGALAAYAFARATTLTRYRADVQLRNADAQSDLAIELGHTLWSQPNVSSLLSTRVAEASARCDAALGIRLPPARVREDSAREPDGYALRLHGVVVHEGRAPNASQLGAQLDEDLELFVRQRARELLGMDDVRRALDALAEERPALVRALVPEPISLGMLAETLRLLVDEGVSVRPLARILETLAGASDRGLEKHPSQLAELARHALREQIARDARGANTRDTLRVHRVDPLIEDAVRNALSLHTPGRALPLPRELATDIVRAVSAAKRDALALVLVTQPELRRALWELLSPELPRVRVLSYSEIPSHMLVEEAAPITP